MKCDEHATPTFYAASKICSADPSLGNMISSLRIRASEPDDIDSIKHLFDVSFPIIYGDQYFDSIRDKWYNDAALDVFIAEVLLDAYNTVSRME